MEGGRQGRLLLGKKRANGYQIYQKIERDKRRNDRGTEQFKNRRENNQVLQGIIHQGQAAGNRPATP
jgi:hypothetical protein